jgi:site-specific DNA recombinase
MNVVVGQNQLEINAEEQEVIRIIRNARAHGMSLNAIAKDLNDREIPSKRGGRWYASSVRNVINRAPELAMFRNLE